MLVAIKNILKKIDNFKGSFNIQSAPFLRFRTVSRAALCQIGLFKQILCCRELICVSSLVYFYQHMF